MLLAIFAQALASVCVAAGVIERATAADDSLTVRAKTGTFVGDLNDTYTNVRQFKYVPYGKVSPRSYC